MSIARSLVILGCSQRKKRTSRLIAAIDRYDGPAFWVLRKHVRDVPGASLDTYILSGRFGLIPGKSLIPRYNRLLSDSGYAELRACVERQLKATLAELRPDRLFVSVGREYWPLLAEPLTSEVEPERLVVARGSIGGRASQLAHWLRSGQDEKHGLGLMNPAGEAVLLGTTVRISREEVLSKACEAMLEDPAAAGRFETWYVAVGNGRVAPKWLASILFNKPVAQFRTADARRVLSLLGVDCVYAGH